MHKELLLSLTLGLVFYPATTLAVSSTNFEIDNDQEFSGSHHQVNSTTFELEGDIGPFGGSLSSTSFSLESGGGSWYCGDGFIDPDEDCDSGSYGSILGGASCISEGFTSGTISCSSACSFVTSSCTSTSSSGGGGGGGGGGRPRNEDEDSTTITTPTSSNQSSSGRVVTSENMAYLASIFTEYTYTVPNTTTTYDYFTYSPFIFIYGSKVSDSISVQNNTSSATSSSPISWSSTVALSYHLNSVSLIASDSDKTYDPGYFTVQRRPAGDANGDILINDYDASLIINRFGATPAPKEADFNEDGEVDEFDISLMLGNWGNLIDF